MDRLTFASARVLLLALAACNGSQAACDRSQPESSFTPHERTELQAAGDEESERAHIETDTESNAPIEIPGARVLNASEAAPILDVCRRFVSGLERGDATAVLSLVGPDAIVLWEDLRAYALGDTRWVVGDDEEPLARVVARSLDQGQLKRMSGRELFEQAIREGWFLQPLLIGDMSRPIAHVARWHDIDRALCLSGPDLEFSFEVELHDGKTVVSFLSLFAIPSMRREWAARSDGIPLDVYNEVLVDRVVAEIRRGRASSGSSHDADEGRPH